MNQARQSKPEGGGKPARESSRSHHIITSVQTEIGVEFGTLFIFFGLQISTYESITAARTSA